LTARRKKVLFIAEAVTLAHVGRAARLAAILHDSGDADVEFASDDRYQHLVHASHAIHSIHSISSAAFLGALAHGRPVFSERVLAGYVLEDLALLERTRPDVVVGDFRLSLSVSARVAGIPYVNVTNAYWSPYARPRFHMPVLPGSRVLGPALADTAFAVIRPIAFAIHAAPMNRIRRLYRLPSLGGDVRDLYSDGDLTLYADLPELIPTFDAPASHRHIGAVLWSPAVDAPAWWDRATGGAAPIYVTLGSSGRVNLLSMIIEALLPLRRPIVVATAGRGEQPQWAPDVWVAPFVRGEAIAAKACLFVCNGGSPTVQQALVRGVPVIGIASNLDQFLNMHYVERFGAGSLLGADRLTVKRLRACAEAAIGDTEASRQARALSAFARNTRSEVAFPAAIRNVQVH
jgi:UDP:flavonoid glycosyltransferase YjiC (YdhE family)